VIPCRSVHVTGSFPVALGTDDAFPLFTASGERPWVDGWDPHFPDPTADETEPGTVFTTAHGGRETTWVVAHREGRRLIAYANVTPGRRATRVAVALAPSAGGTTVTVSYDVTALIPGANAEVEEFATHYAEFLEEWQDAIEALASAGRGGAGEA